jgi:GDP-4-dehydro-6-deoxy-D-mannose reductase
VAVRVFITGITGPVGSALADYVLTQVEDNIEVHAFKRWRSDVRPIAHLHDQITFHEGDIEDPFSIGHALERARPERIYHLAAQSYPSASWEAPVATMRTNVEGTINLLEGARLHCPTANIHIAGSSAEYGWVKPEDTPIVENRPLRPLSPYGVSKAAAEMVGLQYHTSYDLAVVVTRSFNHVGPHQGDRCAIQTFCRQMVAIEKGLQEPVMLVGNLEPRRDFTHTTDAARALWLLLEQGIPGKVYNLCSGKAIRIGDIVDMVRKQGQAETTVQVDPARLRPADEPLLVGNNSQLRAVTGWEAQIDMEAIVVELLDFWRARL